MTLWALHIADGVLTTEWALIGFLLAGGLALFGLFRLREEDVPRIALMTAAFFIVSLIHIRIGPTSVHLLLSGLLGVILGRQVALAIPLGLTLQMILVAHGGFSTIGINSCILVIPALLIGVLFRRLYGQSWTKSLTARCTILALSSLLWLSGLVFSVALLVTNADRNQSGLDLSSASSVLLHPITLISIGLLTTLFVWQDQRRKVTSDQALSLLLGVLAVMLSAVLNSLVLLWGGVTSWDVLAVAILIVHLPVAVLEGILISCSVSFLAKAKPELLGLESVTEIPPRPVVITGEQSCTHATVS